MTEQQQRERKMTTVMTTNNNKTLTKMEGSFTVQVVSKLGIWKQF